MLTSKCHYEGLLELAGPCSSVKSLLKASWSRAWEEQGPGLLVSGVRVALISLTHLYLLGLHLCEDWTSALQSLS